MYSKPPITPKDFFSNAAALEAGFNNHFWYEAYQLYLEQAHRDPSRSMEKYDDPRSVRMPFKEGCVDVIARVQPEPREWRIVRFTAFPAAGESGPETLPIKLWHFEDESRPVLGEGALLDENFRW